jgi:hypothetical protein
MDSIKTERRKKSDKSKEKYDRNGGMSQKHIRLAEQILEKAKKPTTILKLKIVIFKMERKISKLIGLQTYIALYTRWPSLYSAINFPMTPQEYYLELVDSVAANINLDIATTGRIIRDDIVRLLTEPPTTEYSPASKLVGSSQDKNPRQSRTMTAIFVVVTTIIAFLTVTLLLTRFVNHTVKIAPLGIVGSINRTGSAIN